MWRGWRVLQQGLHTSSRVCLNGKTKVAAKAPFLLPQDWEAVIGIECHAQLLASTKLFSDAEPNTCVAPYDAGFPGTLPRLQPAAVTAALKAALALQCHIVPISLFDRKHYFYADLPFGYQITQKRKPFAHSGRVSICYEDGYLASQDAALDVPIEHLQLEQDTAKSTYAATDSGVHLSLLDFNRAGVALVEIVSAPVLRTSEQAGAYVRKLRQLLRCVGASDGNMNEGSLRCDANVSVRRKGEEFGTRCEIKNLNSVKFMMHALDYEIQRHYTLLARGESVIQETRGFDEARGTTYTLRDKEKSVDYRFMPEPNVGPLRITNDRIEALRAALPELPDARHKRLREQYGLSPRDINVLMRLNAEDDTRGPSANVAMHANYAYFANAVDYFEALVRLKCPPQVAANWTIHLLPKHLGAMDLPFCLNPLPPAVVAELVHMVDEELITRTFEPLTAESTANSLLRDFIQARTFPTTPAGELALRSHVREQALSRLQRSELVPICADVAARFPEEVAAIRKGKDKVLMRLVGEAMRLTQGRADPAQLTEVLREEVAKASST